jgi:hypothetical protein
MVRPAGPINGERPMSAAPKRTQRHHRHFSLFEGGAIAGSGKYQVRECVFRGETSKAKEGNEAEVRGTWRMNIPG